MPLAAMLKSLEINLADNVSVEAFLLVNRIRPNVLRKLLRSIDSERISITVIHVADRLLAGLPVFGHVSAAAYCRILLPGLLPGRVSRVIYLDCDMIVLGNIMDLWYEPMAGMPLLAAQEEGRTISCPSVVGHFEESGLPPDTKYFNSGVLVLDLDQWRKEAIHTEVLKYLRKHRDRIRFWDQDALNAVLATKWRELSPEWNMRIDCADKTTQEEPNGMPVTGLRGAGIVHFASSLKPWHYYADHPATELFFSFLDMTAWRGWRPRPPLKALANRHFWGAKLRRIPGAGRMWEKLR